MTIISCIVVKAWRRISSTAAQRKRKTVGLTTFYNRTEKKDISTLVIGYNHRMSWDMGMLITHCVCYAA